MSKKCLTLALLLYLFLLVSSLFADAREDMQVIIGLYEDENYNLAMTEIEKFRLEYPQDALIPVTIFVEGNIALQRHHYQAADSLYAQVPATGITEEMLSEMLLGQVQAKFFLGNYEQSEKIAKDYLQTYPQAANAWQVNYWLSRIALQKADYATADREIHKIRLSPMPASVKAVETELSIKMGNLLQADTIVKDMITANAGDEYTNQAYLQLLQALYNAGRYQDMPAYLNYQIPPKSQYYNEWNLLLAKAAYTSQNYKASLSYLDKMPMAKKSSFINH
jgi:outer membrane protein assembly factor BamD (BamD/ComL family)